MTSVAFRSSPTRCAHLRELLSDPILQEALVTLQDENLPAEVEREDMDAIASVRRLSRRVGWTGCIQALLALADPIALPSETETPRTYGTEFNADEAP